MAKKKKGKKGKGKKGSMGINFAGLLGMGGGSYADKKFLDAQLSKFITDPKIKAVAKIAIGEFAPKQQFVKNLLNNDAALLGIGSALSVHGIDELMTSMNIAGMGADKDELAVAVEGVDDTDMSGDISTVGDDVLGDDDMGADVLGEDDDMGGDISTVGDDDY